MSVIEDTEVKINNLLTARNEEINSLAAELEQDNKDIQKAREQMEKASDNGNLKEYQTAKNRLANSTDSFEMHNTRSEKLQNSPIISEDEYNQMNAALIEDMDKENAEAISLLAEKAEEMAAIGKALGDKGKTVNSLLAKIETDLRRNADRHLNSNGTWKESVKSYGRHYNTVQWAQDALNGDTYREFKKAQKKQQEADNGTN